MKKTNYLIRGKIGEFFTRAFLKSKQVKMVSEGDYLARLRCCCKVVYSMPIQIIWIALFFYARIVVQKYMNNSANGIKLEDLWLYKDQINVLNTFMFIQIYHLFIMSAVLIVMLNMTMGKGTTFFTTIFNILYISEGLLYGSFLFVLDWVGILHKFQDISQLLEILKTQWLWIFAIFIALFSYVPLKSIFKDINMWNREWIRIQRYRKTEDRENGFIFKTWVTPGEIKARILMISAGWFLIVSASVFHLMDVFASTNFNTIKYIILISGYIIFLTSYVIPYNTISLIFYWIYQFLLFAFVIYALYMVQNVAWLSFMWYHYLNLILLIPWMLSLSSSIRYTWTIKDKEEIKAVALNMFETEDDFEEFIDEKEVEQKVKESENII
ncbi:hypothetical protein [Spiroplasma endosymbiont of Atherix ibis]|uniref:hypothetical protein n=1 Tax=Spiroplasma endosymbiont of Atherix ibis TaxID=3066291 RepID=UPI0030CB2D69